MYEKVNYGKRRIITLIVVLVLAAGTAAGIAWNAGAFKGPGGLRAAPVAGVTPLDNNCSGGYVTFTFDDGPGPAPGFSGHTQSVINELVALHLQAVFFVIGKNITLNPLGAQIIREEVYYGNLVENHTYTHASFTGYSDDKSPLTLTQVASELTEGDAAIMAAGAPMPTLYRPPFGDVTAADNQVAAGLGLRIVMDYGRKGSNTILDSLDWEPISPAQIVHNVTHGYFQAKRWVPPMHAGTIIAMHDADAYAANTVASLPGIVSYMNAHDFCATTKVPANATGNVVPDYPVTG